MKPILRPKILQLTFACSLLFCVAILSNHYTTTKTTFHTQHHIINQMLIGPTMNFTIEDDIV